VIIGHHSGGLAVCDSRDGSYIYNGLSLGSAKAPVHYQPSVCDVDQDGNLEMMMQDAEHTSNPPVVFDLVTHQVDSILSSNVRSATVLPVVPGKFGPQLADVTGDGAMDIILCNDTDIFVFDKTYTMVDHVGPSWEAHVRCG